MFASVKEMSTPPPAATVLSDRVSVTQRRGRDSDLVDRSSIRQCSAAMPSFVGRALIFRIAASRIGPPRFTTLHGDGLATPWFHRAGDQRGDVSTRRARSFARRRS